MPVLIDFAWMTVVAGCISAGIGAYVSKETYKRLIPAFRSTQIANWRKYGLAIAIAAPVLQSFALSDLHHHRINLSIVAFFGAPLFYLLCYQVGSYPWRRKFLGETWSLPSMLIFQTRFFLVFYAPMFALLLAPIVSVELKTPWLATPAMFVIWICWWQYNPWIARCMGAKELRNPQLCERLNRLAKRSDVPSIRWLECGPPLGSFGNAFALAAPAWCKQHAVLITTPMLNTCTDEEIEAVCAHEIAHLEDYNSEKQQRIVLQFALPAILAGGVFPWVMSINDSGRWLGLFAWVYTWFVISKWINRRRLGEETGSDRRAFELMDNPLHLATALTKLYELLGSPRRVLAAAEVGVTHPSLARRIGLIRSAANLAEPPVPACCVRGISGGQLSITQDHLTLVLPAKKKQKPALPMTIPWNQLATIQLIPQQKTAILLVQAIDAAQPTRFPFDLQAAAEIEPIIQTADHRIAPLTAVMRQQGKPKRILLRFMIILSALPALCTIPAGGALAFILLPAMIGCAIAASRSWLMTLGTAQLCVAAYAFLAHDPSNEKTKALIGCAALLIPFGICYLLSAAERRRDFVAAYPRGNPWIPLIIMSLAGAAAALATPAIGLIGLAAALAPLLTKRRRSRKRPH